MHEGGENSIGDRRIRLEEPSARFGLHENINTYFPNAAVFKELSDSLNELRDKDFAGLREESCQFALIKATKSIERNLKKWINFNKEKGIISEDVKGSEIASALKRYEKEDGDINLQVAKNDIDLEFFTNLTKSFKPDQTIIETKGWTKEQYTRFFAKLSERVFKSGQIEWPEKIPLDVLISFHEKLHKSIKQLIENKEAVAREYLANQVKDKVDLQAVHYPIEDAKQSEADKEKIEGARKLSKYELAKEVLPVVRQNSEYVRRNVIPKLIEDEADTQTAFWEIHKGEFHKNPLAAQMLASGVEVEVMDYVASRGGSDFYDQNIGQSRKIDVNSGGFKHIAPKYLPQLQAELFNKLDSITDIKSEDDFITYVTMVDIVMYSLHLPFDGSGRAIEDFICFLGEKYNRPLTFSVLGYRETGSPLLPLKENVGPIIKQEINSLALKNLGIVTSLVTEMEAISKICTHFTCNADTAQTVLSSEKALITSEIVQAIGDKDAEKTVQSSLNGFLRLKDLWKQTRTLRFYDVPPQFENEVDDVTALISSKPDDKEVIANIFSRLDKLKVNRNKQIRQIATLIEAYALLTIEGPGERNSYDNYYQVFPETPEVIKTASEEGSLFTRIKAKIKLATTWAT